jgi:hypothetical protein
MTEKKIPNFNTFSTLIDRLSIENVKLAHFQFLKEINTESNGAIDLKINIQIEVINLLKDELRFFMTEVFINKRYDFIDEERTFK